MFQNMDGGSRNLSFSLVRLLEKRVECKPRRLDFPSNCCPVRLFFLVIGGLLQHWIRLLPRLRFLLLGNTPLILSRIQALADLTNRISLSAMAAHQSADPRKPTLTRR